MSISFGNAFITVLQSWTVFKTTVAAKAMAIQYDDDGSRYNIFAVDAPIVYLVTLNKGTLPDIPGVDQAQNDADKSDFETNYKTISNKPLDMATTISGSLTGSGLIGFYGAYVPTAATTLVAIRPSTFVEQLSIASRSFSSTSANDNASGSGTRQIILTYYDNSMNGPYTETLFLSGTTNVNTVNGNIRFVESIKTTLSGNNGGNVGNVNMFAAVAGAGGIIAQIPAGDGKTYYAHHYIRPNKTFYLENMFLNTSGSAGGVSFRVLNPFNLNSFEDQVGTTFRANSSDHGEHHFDNSIQVVGPARVTFYAKPDSSAAATFFVNFGWSEY